MKSRESGIGSPRINPAEKVQQGEEQLSREALVCELLEIRSEELHQFVERIDRNGGHVRISVHPLFLEKSRGIFSSYDTGKSVEEVKELMSEGFTKIVDSVHRNPKSSPLLIFEEHQRLLDTTDKIANHTKVPPEQLSTDGFLLVPTDAGGGYIEQQAASDVLEEMRHIPANASYDVLKERRERIRTMSHITTPDKATIEYWSTHYSQTDQQFLHEKTKEKNLLYAEHQVISSILLARQFEIFTTLIQTLNIRSATISGAFFDNRFTHDKAMGGCAGRVNENLRGLGVATDISRFAWAPPSYLEAQGYETKQTGKE